MKNREEIRNANFLSVPLFGIVAGGGTSGDEGQGMAILEAMAIGVPVLVRNCAGVEDYLRDGQNAIALKSNATRDVANTIEWALDHPDETSKLSLQAWKMVEVTYPWNKTVLAMETVYGIWEAR